MVCRWAQKAATVHLAIVPISLEELYVLMEYIDCMIQQTLHLSVILQVLC